MPKRSLTSVDLPGDVPDLLRTLAQGVRQARLRRRWPQRVLAEKAGVSVESVQAVEAGRGGTSIGSVLAMLWAMRLTHPLYAIGSPETDAEGRALEAMAARRRARPSQPHDDLDTDF